MLFTSGYTTRLVEKEWPAERADLLRKPYRSIDLAQRVRAALDRFSPRRSRNAPAYRPASRRSSASRPVKISALKPA